MSKLSQILICESVKLIRMLPLFYIYFITVICNLSVALEYFLSNISGEVEKGNFVYSSMPYEGTILLELTSVSGDCDLYVSQFTKTPGYEPESHCLQSATCGVDSVIIPKGFKRPVGIGIFSHPSHDVCSFNLMFYKIEDSRDIFNYNSYEEYFDFEADWKTMKESQNSNRHEESSGFGTDRKARRETQNSDTPEHEESFFWVILRSFIVLLIESII